MKDQDNTVKITDEQRDIIKWLEEKIKAEQLGVEQTKKLCFPSDDMCLSLCCDEAKIKGMIEIKISLEKYFKKLYYARIEKKSK